MKLSKSICENCGGNLKRGMLSQIKNKELICSYCGSVYIANAKHSKIGAEWEVELERLKELEKREGTKAEWEYRKRQDERKSNNRVLLWLSIFVVFSLLLLSIGAYIENHPRGVEITVNNNDFQGENYKIATKKLKDMGFKNIKIEKVEDLKYGIFKEDGDVKEVTINGGNDFKKGDYVDEKSTIKVYYHTFK